MKRLAIATMAAAALFGVSSCQLPEPLAPYVPTEEPARPTNEATTYCDPATSYYVSGRGGDVMICETPTPPTDCTQTLRFIKLQWVCVPPDPEPEPPVTGIGPPTK